MHCALRNILTLIGLLHMEAADGMRERSLLLEAVQEDRKRKKFQAIQGLPAGIAAGAEGEEKRVVLKNVHEAVRLRIDQIKHPKQTHQ